MNLAISHFYFYFVRLLKCSVKISVGISTVLVGILSYIGC